MSIDPNPPLLLTAFAVGVVHAAVGVDHSLPFVALARSRAWSLRRTLGWTLLAGTGHVLGSVLIAALAICIVGSLPFLTAFESGRADLAGWGLIGFGLAYTVYAWRRQRRAAGPPDGSTRDPGWVLFLLLTLGPCEPLIPLLMLPSTRHSWPMAATVALTFLAATLATMVTLVALGHLASARLAGSLATVPILERVRWQPLAGCAIALSGLAVLVGL